MCLCVVCMCIYDCGYTFMCCCAYMYSCMWEQEVDVGCFSWSLSFVFTEAAYFGWKQSSPTWPAPLATLFWESWLSARITGRPICPLNICLGTGDLNSSPHAFMVSDFNQLSHLFSPKVIFLNVKHTHQNQYFPCNVTFPHGKVILATVAVHSPQPFCACFSLYCPEIAPVLPPCWDTVTPKMSRMFSFYQNRH